MKRELTDDEYVEYSLKHNTPKMLFPIINTIISVALFVALIVFFVNKEINLGFLIFGIIVVILFPISSWYSSYFSKKKTTQKLNDFKKETESLVKYASTFKGYTMIENENLKYTITEEGYLDKKAEFNQSTCLINSGKINGTLISYGVSFVGLDINPKTKTVTNVTGMLPTSIWFDKKLNVPTAINGSVTIQNNELKNYMVIQELTKANTYYDKRTGWVCIGNKNPKNTKNIKIMDNVIISIQNGEITSFWINVGILELNNGKNKGNEK